MKVCVMTKAGLFGKEEFVEVYTDCKVAEKNLRKFAPNARKDPMGDSYVVKDHGKDILYFLREKQVL